MKYTGEKRKLWIAGCALACVVVVCVAALLVAQALGDGNANDRLAQNVASPVASVESAVAPEKLQLYRDLSSVFFFDEQGTKVSVPQLTNKPCVLVYWASWCPMCHSALQDIDSLAQEVQTQGGALYLVNKLDGEKETMEKAQAYLREKGIALPTLYDPELQAYQTLGLSVIPTTLVLDTQGRLTGFAEGMVPEKTELWNMLADAQTGKAARMCAFLQKYMQNQQGGIRTNYLDEGEEIPSGADVLSESQGLVMLYAAQLGDRALFDRLWTYTQEHSTDADAAQGGLAAWVITEEDGPSSVNAAVDDLRIYRALALANSRWGDYNVALSDYARSLAQYNVHKDVLVDFYDFNVGEKATRLTLRYADLAALRSLAQTDAMWQGVAERCEEILQGGVISDDFPLYHSYYDYSTGRYNSGDTLHMSETLLTLLHLSRAQQLPVSALQWLRECVCQEGVLYARYTLDGQPAGDPFESTAVYGLCALIACSEGDAELASAATQRMEQMRVQVDACDLPAFGNADGSGIYSFDQCVALLAYAEMEAIGE